MSVTWETVVEIEYRVKREGVERWVPQWRDKQQPDVWWNDFWDVNGRVAFETKEEAQDHNDQKQRARAGSEEYYAQHSCLF